MRRLLRVLRDKNLEAVPGTCPSSGEYVSPEDGQRCPTCGQDADMIEGVRGALCWDWHDER